MRAKPRPTLNHAAAGTAAFQTYQPGATYQPTSQYPADQMRSYHGGQPGSSTGLYLQSGQHGSNHNDLVDTADESDVVSIKPAKARSGNTFTVKKVSLAIIRS